MKKVLFALYLLMAGATIGFAQSFDRGLGNLKATYIPKGQFSWGVSGSYSGWAAKGAGDDLSEGVSFAGLISDVNGELGLFSIDTHASWFFKDNWSVGVRVGYKNTLLDANHLSLVNLVSLSNRHLRRETYSGVLAGRRYVPLFNSRFLGLFGEVGLGGGIGYNKSYENTDRGKEGTFSTLYDISLTASGGLSFFIMDNMSLEVSVPVFSAGYEWNNMIEKQEYESSLNGFHVSKVMNILGTSFGIVCFF